MTTIQPNSQALATAQGLLLDPYGLDMSHLHSALGEIFTHKVDYADLYFQYTRSEGWSLEEGIVKTGSFSIEQGVGVRALSGEKTAFAYSDTLSPEALLSSAHAVRSIARQGAGRIKVANDFQHSGARALYGEIDPVASMEAADKVALLGRLDRCPASGAPEPDRGG